MFSCRSRICRSTDTDNLPTNERIASPICRSSLNCYALIDLKRFAVCSVCMERSFSIIVEPAYMRECRFFKRYILSTKTNCVIPFLYCIPLPIRFSGIDNIPVFIQRIIVCIPNIQRVTIILIKQINFRICSKHFKALSCIDWCCIRIIDKFVAYALLYNPIVKPITFRFRSRLDGVCHSTVNILAVIYDPRRTGIHIRITLVVCNKNTICAKQCGTPFRMKSKLLCYPPTIPIARLSVRIIKGILLCDCIICQRSIFRVE